MRYVDKSIPNRSRPGLPTTTSGVARQGTCENYATAGLNKNKSRKREGRRVKRQRKMWKGRRTLIRVGTLNIGTMAGRRRKQADMMERRNVDTEYCTYRKQSGKGVKRGILEVAAANYFTTELMEEKNEIGIVVREEMFESVLEVKKVSDRLMAIKLEVKGLILNTVSVYAPQVNNSMQEKNDF